MCDSQCTYSKLQASSNCVTAVATSPQCRFLLPCANNDNASDTSTSFLSVVSFVDSDNSLIASFFSCINSAVVFVLNENLK